MSYYRSAFRGYWNSADGTVRVVRIPVTVIWGDQDPYLLPIVADADNKTAPNLTVVHLPKVC